MCGPPSSKYTLGEEGDPHSLLLTHVARGDLGSKKQLDILFLFLRPEGKPNMIFVLMK